MRLDNARKIVVLLTKLKYFEESSTYICICGIFFVSLYAELCICHLYILIKEKYLYIIVMLKAFISHSSAQKEYALELVEKLGRDLCIIDCYDFEPAYKTMSEILKHIESCSMFVLLISKESLVSDWVKKEIYNARKQLNEGGIDRFLPYIIDEGVSLDDVPEWIAKEECYNLKKFKSPLVLARDIEQKFRCEIWKQNSQIRKLESVMTGRNDEISTFERKLYSNRGRHARALIVSGREGVGKQTFIKQCFAKVGYVLETEPFMIPMYPKESVEDFIVGLNNIARMYKETQLQEELRNAPADKAQIAVRLLKELCGTHLYLLVHDDMACVLPKRELPDWLVDVLTNPELPSKISMGIMSKIHPNAYLESDCPFVIHVSLDPLNRSDRKKLFYNYAQIFDIEDISEQDADFFVDRLLHSPEQIRMAVETIRDKGLLVAKRDIQRLIDAGDKKIKTVLDHFKTDKQRQMLVLLSKLDFFSYSILEKIYEDEIKEMLLILDEMIGFGVVSNFGPTCEFFKLDSYISDYLRRNHFKLSGDLELLVHDVFESLLSESTDITEDVSVYMYQVRHNIENGKATEQDYLIPSVALKVLIDRYNNKDYPTVEKICKTLLEDGAQRYYKEVRREIVYWLCLVLCRKQKYEEFIEYVKEINGADHTFLHGFYQRIAKNYPKAEMYLKQTLENAPTMQRAKRELVTVYLSQHKYAPALSLAKDNYEQNPDNSYHVSAYFRCLVRKSDLSFSDREKLKQLMDEMRNSYSEQREEIYGSMQIEYKHYIGHATPDEMLPLIDMWQAKFPHSDNIRRAGDNYKYRQKLINEEKFYAEDI